MSKELFFEIGSEEIPAGFLPKAMADMEGLIRKELESARIEFSAIETMAAPRRLVLVVRDLAEEQPNLFIRAMGPAKNVAFGADGTPSKAAEGFARGQGVSVSDLKIIATEKGEYLCAEKEESGRPTAQLLTEILPRLIAAIPFKKSMRWKDLDVRFARPLHWIVALYGGEIVPFSFGDIHSGNASCGHRFMANTPFAVRDFADYLAQCEKHFVIPSPARRREIISRDIAALAKTVGGEVLADAGLLDEVTFLCEYPSAVLGTFNPDFLQVPKEVLITSMRSHQRYFSLVDASGKLLPCFITINNTLSDDPSVVVKGNERVLRARLSDARFFYEEDQKVPLADRVEALKSVVYQQKLGTSYEKMERFRALSGLLASRFAPELQIATERAATLCKADLVSGMVGEFPEVQGIMGRDYALRQGESLEVANAIAEHYLPTAAGGELPTSEIGAFVSIADKLDTICGCFGVGLIPTGSADPYALRRCAIGILNIVISRNLTLSLPELIGQSLDLLNAKLTRPRAEVQAEVIEFFRGRLLNILTSQGYATDLVEAVLAARFDDPSDAGERVKALALLKEQADFEPLAAAFKRIGNIIKGGVDAPIEPALFEADCEGALFHELQKVEAGLELCLEKRDYTTALRAIAALRPTVDAFFDGVMVMAENPQVRSNRLALLTSAGRLFSGIADFAKIA
ncbi:MAG: glycine--tRNA ligase subunit beta [Desulfuromonadales bacterium]|nr:glycine--tRNA ligase subunit beta [Desulfuromonadales bacterium]